MFSDVFLAVFVVVKAVLLTWKILFVEYRIEVHGMGSAEVKGVAEELGGFLRETCVCVSTPGVPRPKNQKKS